MFEPGDDDAQEYQAREILVINWSLHFQPNQSEIIGRDLLFVE